MHDAGAIAFTLDVAQVLDAAMVDQGIDQRAIGMIDRRMAHKPRLLGDDKQVVVLVADIERYGLTLYGTLLRGVRHLVHHRIACA